MTVTLTPDELRAAGFQHDGQGRAIRVRVGSGGKEQQGTGSMDSSALRPTASPYRSKWEAERAEYHEMRKRAGLIRDWRYEAVRLKLADGAWYKSDFLISDNDGFLELEEVKGFWR